MSSTLISVFGTKLHDFNNLSEKIIDAYEASRSLSLSSLDTQGRRSAMCELNDIAFFDLPNSITSFASRSMVTKVTVYKDMGHLETT